MAANTGTVTAPLDELMCLYTMADYMDKPLHVRVRDDGFVTEVNGEAIDPTPIEDYGDYLLADAPLDNAFFQWCAMSGGILVTATGHCLAYHNDTGEWSDGRGLSYRADDALRPVDTDGNRINGDFLF